MYVLASAAALTLHAAIASAEPLNFKPLALTNNWTPYDHGTRNPAVAIDDNGVVHFKGAITSGTDKVFAILPAKYRPKGGLVYVATNLFSGVPGRIIVEADGTATVEGDPEDAALFTSLDGVSYAK
jgi:hypothetical protein